MNKEIVLDVRDMPPRERHPKIFKAWEELPVGGAIKLLNDHDPKPLLYVFRAERGGEFEWTPLESGPQTWSVAIKRIAAAAASSGGPPPPSAERPAWASKKPAIEVDVRDDLRAGGEPFPKIMAAAMRTQPGEVFVLRALFEPQPLYRVLSSKGFEAWSERLAEDDWKVYFHKKQEGKIHVLDVSGLEPPQPMVAILAKIHELGPGESLEVSHHREPLPLYPLLEEACFAHEIEKLGENSYRLRIRRKDG